jgi:hypothetical protein
MGVNEILFNRCLRSGTSAASSSTAALIVVIQEANAMSSFNFRGCAVFALAGVLVCGEATAAPFANVPSVTQVGRPLTLTGGGFEPGALINLRVSGPGKTVTMAAVVVAADGTISHTLVAAGDGPYSIQLVHPDGRSAASDLKFSASR